MTATATLNASKPYKQNGVWHYPELPTSMRHATITDFNILTTELIFGINIMFQPVSGEAYQARIIRNTTDLKKYSPDIIAGKVYVDKLPYKQCGLYYYPHMPLGCRKAVFSDFLTVDHEIIPGVDFLVLGTGSQELEAHRSTDVEHIVKWIDWIAAGRVYVKAN
jgi:hypothetical protein